MKTRAWTEILLVFPQLPWSSKHSLQPNYWLKCKFSLIDISSNMRHYTRSPWDIVCTVRMSVLNTWALMPILKQTVFKMVCKDRLEGRGNSEWRYVQDLGLCFRRERATTSSLKLHLLPSCLLFVTIYAKNLGKLKEDEKACIRGLLSNWQTSFILLCTSS